MREYISSESRPERAITKASRPQKILEDIIVICILTDHIPMEKAKAEKAILGRVIFL